MSQLSVLVWLNPLSVSSLGSALLCNPEIAACKLEERFVVIYCRPSIGATANEALAKTARVEIGLDLGLLVGPAAKHTTQLSV